MAGRSRACSCPCTLLLSVWKQWKLSLIPGIYLWILYISVCLSTLEHVCMLSFWKMKKRENEKKPKKNRRRHEEEQEEETFLSYRNLPAGGGKEEDLIVSNQLHEADYALLLLDWRAACDQGANRHKRCNSKQICGSDTQSNGTDNRSTVLFLLLSWWVIVVLLILLQWWVEIVNFLEFLVNVRICSWRGWWDV